MNAVLRIFDLKLQLEKRRGKRYVLVEAGVFQEDKRSKGLPRPCANGSLPLLVPPPALRQKLSARQDVCQALVALFRPDFDPSDVKTLLQPAMSRSESDRSLSFEIQDKAALANGLAALMDVENVEVSHWFDDTEALNIALWRSLEEPDTKEALDHARATMDHYVSLCGQERIEMPSDGSCQFHALIRVLGLSIDHIELRQTLVDWLRRNGDTLLPNGAKIRNFVKEPWDPYCDALARPSEWGNHLTLVAFASVFGVPIQVFGAAAEDHITETIIAPVPESNAETARQVVLAGPGVTIAYLATRHYDAVLFDPSLHC